MSSDLLLGTGCGPASGRGWGEEPRPVSGMRECLCSSWQEKEGETRERRETAKENGWRKL